MLALLALGPVWIGGGLVLLFVAVWPSSCVPAELIEVYSCSPRLPESGRWQELLLLTWLWATPLLTMLALTRRASDRLEHRSMGDAPGNAARNPAGRASSGAQPSSPRSAAASPRPP